MIYNTNNELIIILCKQKNNYCDQLYKYLIQHIYCLIITEKKLPNTYYGLNRLKETPIAWENAFFTLQKLPSFNYYWFIEDDVYTNDFNQFMLLISFYRNNLSDLIACDIRHKEQDPNWYWWSDKTIVQRKHMTRSFNPLCRLSNRLISEIEIYRKLNNGFCFHETLFASLCSENNFLMTDYLLEKNPYIGSIHWRPIMDRQNILDNKIYHPVKMKT